MTHKFAIKLMAFFVTIYWATAVFPHGNHVEDKAKGNALAAEQKNWGVAGEAKAAQRTITIRMSDDMRS
jgi:uncharacterized protein (DUF4415 family)